MGEKKFSLIMPVYGTSQFLKRAIDSILDQDYEGYELIIVMDGKDKNAERIIKKYKNKRIKSLTIKHSGAPAARNAGAKISNGDYLSFFSSDFVMFPGCLRTWAMHFSRNPDCSFVYGGYRFNSNDYSVYPSEPFDPWRLEMENYIDGGFPMKREIWERFPWDESIKSLQDWDFWLQAVRNGYKGKFIRDITYMAELPRAGGLSDDSHKNWLERTNLIKKKHKIPLRDICVVSFGAPYHAKKVAKLLDADYKINPAAKQHRYKMIYLLGYYPYGADMHASVFMHAPKGCKRVVHWLGGDIEQLTSFTFKNLKMLSVAMNSHIDMMLVESQAKQTELKEMGFKTDVLPLLRDTSWLARWKYPDKFTVGVYYPRSKDTTQNQVEDFMDLIAKSMPDIKFKFFGDSSIKRTIKNVEFCGWADMQTLIPKCSMLLRYSKHDGLPTTPMEFMIAGRYVLTNAEMPYVIPLKGNEASTESKKEIVQKIRKIKRMMKQGDLPSREAEVYYRNLLNAEENKKVLLSIRDKGKDYTPRYSCAKA